MSTRGERRSTQRMDLQMPVEERTDGTLYFQRTTNLSSAGVHLEGTLPHAAGTRVELKLRLPGESLPISVVGEVVEHDQPLGMAIRFTEMDPTAAAQLDKLA